MVNEGEVCMNTPGINSDTTCEWIIKVIAADALVIDVGVVLFSESSTRSAHEQVLVLNGKECTSTRAKHKYKKIILSNIRTHTYPLV